MTHPTTAGPAVPAPAAFPERLAIAGLFVTTTVFAAFAVLLAGGSGSLERVGVRVAYDLMALGAIVPWLMLAAVRPAWLPASRLWPGILACLAAFGIATVTSRVPRLSAEMLAYALLTAGIYLFLVALMRRPRLRAYFERLALVLCVVVCSLYLLQTLLAWRDWWGLVGRFVLPPLRPEYQGLSLGSPNPLATLVLVLGSFSLATSRIRGRAGLAVAVVVPTLVGVAVLITGSRGAWLGAGVGLAVTGVAALVTTPSARQRARALAGSRYGVIAAAVAVPVVIAASVLAARSGRLTLDDSGYREAFAAASLRMFQSSPLAGIGPGTWQVFRAANETATQPDLYIPHAHNVYWQTLAEFGLLGVAAGAVILLALGALIVRALWSSDSVRRRVALAALFGVVLLGVQQLADMLMNVPALVFAIALPLAWLDAVSLGDPRPDSPAGAGTPAVAGALTAMGARPGAGAPPGTGAPAAPREVAARIACLGAAVVLIVIVGGLLRMESITGVAARATAAADAGRWSDAATLAAEAVADDPGVNAYRFQLGIAAANAGDLRTAEASLVESASADDYPYAWLDLAAVRWRLGDAAGARDALTRAERLGLQRAGIALSAGWLRQQLGGREAAITDYAAALALAPTLASDPFWSSTDVMRDLWPEIWTAAQASGGAPTRLALDLVADRMDLATEDAASLAPGDPALYALLVPAWEGDAGAWADLQALAADRPLDADLVQWARLVATHRGDTAAAHAYSRWLAMTASPDALSPLVARVVTGTDGDYALSFLDRYGSLYRRAVPNAQVVDIVPQLAWQDRF